MSRRGRKDSTSIRTYFGTRSSSSSAERRTISDESRDTKLVRENMAENMADVIKLIKGLESKLDSKMSALEKTATSLEAKITKGFDDVNANITKLTEKVDALEMDIEVMKQTQKDDVNVIKELRGEVDALKYSLLSTQAYARKYHLLLYGVEGHENNPRKTVAKVRKFAKENWKLENADQIVIRNAHRLQKRYDEAPATIVVVFLYWHEREAFLKAGPNLRGSRMSVRTDLPPELKKKRGQLASMAYEMRRDEKIQTRIREKGAEVWLETRDNISRPWKRMELTL
jgi:hypothetical protein